MSKHQLFFNWIESISKGIKAPSGLIFQEIFYSVYNDFSRSYNFNEMEESEIYQIIWHEWFLRSLDFVKNNPEDEKISAKDFTLLMTLRNRLNNNNIYLGLNPEN